MMTQENGQHGRHANGEQQVAGRGDAVAESAARVDRLLSRQHDLSQRQKTCGMHLQSRPCQTLANLKLGACSVLLFMLCLCPK